MISIFFWFFGFLIFAKSVMAVTPPVFPSCVAPQGTLKVRYETGTHGVPGDSGTYRGSDEIFTLSSDTLLQCLCLEDGSGIQTNWWRVLGLTTSEIEALKTADWIHISDGSVWGLEQAPYLAKNSSYTCGRAAFGGIGGGDVLGLATTGTLTLDILLIVFGATLFSLGLYIKKKGH